MSSPIETKRLLLRPFETRDAEDLFSYLHEPAVNCFHDMQLESLEAAAALIRERIEEPQDDAAAIVLKDTDHVIGEISAHPEHIGPGRPEGEPDTWSVMWMLGPTAQGKGYAFEAAEAFFDYLFREKNARRLYAYTEDYNLSSQKLCEKLGMRREGLFREYVAFVKDENGNPIYENTCLYAILRQEWTGRRA